MKYFYKVFVFSFFLLFAYVHASVNSLNGQMGASQTFVNDDNFTITSNSDVHTLGWNGVLSVSRGGLGIDSSSFSTGSIPFFDGTNFTQSSKLNWDDSGSIFSIGGNIKFLLNQNGGTFIGNEPQILSDTKGDWIELQAGTGNGTGEGGDLMLEGGFSNDGNGGTVYLTGGYSVYGNGGTVWIEGGPVGTTTPKGGDVVIIGGSSGVSEDQNGSIKFGKHIVGDNLFSTLDLSKISDNRTFTFPDATGTFSLLESSNTFSNPVNNFISSSTSTVHIGADGFPGCIVMGDSDGSGVTYITADNGVLSASTSAPANCN